MSADKFWNQRAYDFSMPVAVGALAGEDPVIADVVTTIAFQRLKHIRFLGGIDYLVVPAPNGLRGNTRYTRYQHSIGVAWLASLYASKLSLDAAHRRLVCVAALMHDIGHAPLSHSLEPVFKDAFGLDHHGATKKILTGEVPLGRELYRLLRDKNVNIDHVLAIISGEGFECHGFFGGPINFDTIEGILRAHAYTQRKSNFTNPEIVLEAAINRKTERDKSVVDEFWSYKDRVYRHFINSRMGVLADFACQEFMRKFIKKINEKDYYTTELQLFRKLPGLRELLTSRSFELDVKTLFDQQVAYKSRRFFVDVTGDFFKRQDNYRYRQTKNDCILMPQGKVIEMTTEVEQDLFDDDSYRQSEGVLRTYA
jgi:HD superfamily phosphohydrolase